MLHFLQLCSTEAKSEIVLISESTPANKYVFINKFAISLF
jgi:hypothetical protein